MTIFIGGNHEASNHLQELAYGGWVAPNIYYLGYAGVIKVNGITIAGISGIYRGYSYWKGHYECTPYDDNTCRTVYAMRNLEVFRLKQMTPSKIDIMISHDWPQKIWEYGDETKRFGHVKGLLRLKPDFKADMDSGKLGNPPCFDLLKKLKPRYWYSAHMHCRFEAKVKHNEEEETRFVALDKCLPGRNYFDFLTLGEEVERNEDGSPILNLEHDAEWLTILSLTNKYLNCTHSETKLPQEPSSSHSNQRNTQRWNYTPTEEEIDSVLNRLKNDLTLRQNFKQTQNAYAPEWEGTNFRNMNLKKPIATINVQTTEFCDRLGIDDPLLIATTQNNVKVLVPNYTVSDQDAFKDCHNIVSDLETPKKKLQLLLPKPLNEDEIDLDELESDPVEEKKEFIPNAGDAIELKSEKPKSDVLNSESEIKDELTQAETNIPKHKVEGEIETQPTVKKFKRRNQDIYNATDE